MMKTKMISVMKTKMTVKSVENGIHKHDENENDSEIGGKRYS
ncbi:hypothetical protein [Lysinibacillus endophyticus]|nr:hypothetical protein [Lysinibacillus endophyticus]